MKILVVMRAGTRIVSRRTVEAAWVRVGRNASCEIHLPDPRVALEQGLVTRPGEGFLYVEGDAGSQTITRRSVRQVRFAEGEGIDIGPYRLEVEAAPSPGYDATFVVELARPLESRGDFSTRASELTLGSLGLTKRWAAWLWALVVLALFLALPLGRVLELPWRDAAQSSTLGDRFWNPGPVFLAHQPIAQKCAACHESAFQRVKDTSCLECHAQAGRHVAAGAHVAGLFEDKRCANCHREHKGVKATHRDDDELCVSCHRDLKTRDPKAGALDASDFARSHPEFRLSIPTESGVVRTRMGSEPVREASNLAFPHDVHLDPAGVRSPVQGRMKLECRSCHEPDAARRGFLPVSMPKHCQECHVLQFEPAVTTREVPHGKPAEALVVLEEFYASLALQAVPDSFQKAFGVPGEGLLRRVGEPSASEREGALRLARRKARQVGEDLFEVRVCKTCHQVTRGPAHSATAPDWRIAPVRQAAEWMPFARFSHRAHPAVQCVDCHAVATSAKSGDVAMPSITRCRECHGGARPVEGRVTSNCLLCHGFHDARHPWDPAFTPRSAPEKAGKVADAR